MSDMVLGIKLIVDGKEAVGEIRGSAEAVKSLGRAAGESNNLAQRSAEQYTAQLKRQADTLGMTRTQTMAYDASKHQLTATERESIAQSLRAIDAHDKQQVMLGRVASAARFAGYAIGAALVAGLTLSISEAARAEQAHLKLEAVLRATGFAAGFSKAQLDLEAEAMKRRTGFDDDQVRNSMAVMLTFKQVTGETFTAAMQMAADLSKLMGQDLQSSVLQLGKALEDPEAGLTALKRAGVSFNESQKETIKFMVETGNQAEALTLILQIMKSQGIDHIAESMNTGLAGAMNKSKLEWDDLMKAIGGHPGVRTSTIVFFEGVADRLSRIRKVVTDGNWLQQYAALVGMSNPMGLPALSAATMFGDPNRGQPPAEPDFTMSERAAGLGAQDRARVADARDLARNYLKQFRGDNEKLADELKKFRALAASAELPPEDVASGEAKIREKMEKPGKPDNSAEQAARQREAFVAGLEKEAATLGMTTVQVKLYDLAQSQLTASELTRARAQQQMDAVAAGEPADRRGEGEFGKRRGAMEEAPRGREQFVAALLKEAAAFGGTTEQMKVYEAALARLTDGEIARAAAAVETSAAGRAAKFELEAKTKQQMDRVAAEEAAEQRGEEEFEKRRVALETQMTQIAESLLTEEEMQREAHTRRLAALIEANEAGLIADGDMIARREAMEAQHQARLRGIITASGTAQQKWDQKTAQEKTKTVLGELTNLTAGVAQHSRAMFNMNKVAGIASAIVNAYVGISKTLAEYPYPINIGLAALHAAAAFAQVNAIRSAEFQGGGGGSAPSLAGSTPATPVTPVGAEAPAASTAQTQAQQVPRLYSIHITSDGPNREFTEKLVKELSELNKDGFPVFFTTS